MSTKKIQRNSKAKLVVSKKKNTKRSVVSSCLERMLEIKAKELRLEELTQTDQRGGKTSLK